jgi:ribosome maturation factor RimP
MLKCGKILGVGVSPLFDVIMARNFLKGHIIRKDIYMSTKENIVKKTEELLKPIIEDNNFELVDVEYVKEGANYYLRIYIDKEGGINIVDCELVSRAIDLKLEEAELIEDQFILEVSSPGLDRPLKKEKDFKRSIGKNVEIKLYKAVNKQKNFEGELMSYTPETVSIMLENDEILEINRKEIALIRLAFEF